MANQAINFGWAAAPAKCIALIFKSLATQGKRYFSPKK